MPMKDINAATRDDLAKVPQMSSARAETIIHYRDSHGPFTDMAELAEVPGIGQTMAAQMNEYFVVGEDYLPEDQTATDEETSTDDESDDHTEPTRTHRSSGAGGTNAAGQRLNKDGSVDKRQFNRAPSEDGFPKNAADEESERASKRA
jgi:competence ComEA-like helix-hairpin-helix protein